MTKADQLRNALGDNKPHTAMQLAAACGFDSKGVYALLKPDIDKGKVIAHDTRPRTFQLNIKNQQTTPAASKAKAAKPNKPEPGNSEPSQATRQQDTKNANQWDPTNCHETITDYSAWARRMATAGNTNMAAHLYDNIAETAIAAAKALNGG